MIRSSAYANAIIIALALASPVRAEDVAPTPAPSETPAPVASPVPPPAAPAPIPAKFYLEVDQADLASISQALNFLPKYVADPLILRLNGQLAAQAPITEAKDKAEKARKSKK